REPRAAYVRRDLGERRGVRARDMTFVRRFVEELLSPDHVARHEDGRVAALAGAPIPSRLAFPIEREPGLGEIEPREVRAAPGGHEHAVEEALVMRAVLHPAEPNAALHDARARLRDAEVQLELAGQERARGALERR